MKIAISIAKFIILIALLVGLIVYSNDGEASVKIHFSNADDKKHYDEMNKPVLVEKA